jgi:hypothetical protein
MLTQPSKYDVTLIRRMLGENSSSDALSTTERALTVTSLQPGMVVLDDVVSRSGQLLLRAESTLSETSINILWQWHKNDPIAEPIRVQENGGDEDEAVSHSVPKILSPASPSPGRM